MKILATLSIVILAVLFFMRPGYMLGAETTGSAMPGSARNLTFTDSDNGRKVKIAPGGVLTLRLEAVPGTGYAWQIVQNYPNLLKPLGKSTFEGTGKGMPGTAEYQIFHFKALARGCNILKLQYVREWEKDVAPMNSYSLTIQIR